MAVVDELIALLGYEIKGADKLKQWQDSLANAEGSAIDVATATAGATDAIDGLAPAANKATDAVDKTGKSAKQSAKEIDKIGLAAGAATTAAIAVGVAAVKNFAGFEREMTRIGITAGATVSETAAAGNEVQKLAKDFALPLDQAILGLDTLTSSGMNLQQAMSFLPSVLATAQASGASTADIANSIQKVSTSLKITADQSQQAFDIMVAGGKVGQFELKDMAQYIPTLSSQMSALGYTGLDGLKQLVAMLQVMRERTGTSSEAATQLSNVLQKIYSNQTSKAFENAGVDLDAKMKEAVASGEDVVTAFTRITKETMAGDMTLLPKLFADAQFQQGMLTLVTGADAMERFSAALKNTTGVTMIDLKLVLADTQASLDKTSSSLDRFWKSLGGALAGPAGGTLDYLSNDLDYGEAIRAELEKQGMSYWQRENWMFLHAFDQKAKDDLARAGGYTGPVTQNRRTPGVPIFPNQIADLRDQLGTGTAALVDRSSGPNATMADIDAIIARSAIKFNAQDPGRKAIDDLQTKVLAGQQSQFDALRAQIDASLGRATGSAAISPVVNDNRQYPVSVSAPVTVQVQQATQAPAAVGAAVSGAIKQAAQTPGRIAAEPATSWGGPR